MLDTIVPQDWIGRGLASAFGAVLAAGTTIFATRRKTEASLLDKVNARIDNHMARQDAEIERLDRAHQACEQRVNDLIEQLRTGHAPIIPAYTDRDIEAGQKTVRAAIARRKGKT